MKNTIVSTILSALYRYPFWDSLSTMFVIAELESKFESELPFPKWIVFVDIGILFLLGTFLSFQPSARRITSIISAIYLPVHGIIELAFLNQIPVIKEHGITNLLGVVAVYLILASGYYREAAKQKTILQMAYFLFAFMFAVRGILMSTSMFEQSLLMHSMPQVLESFGKSNIVKTSITLFVLLCYGFLSQGYGFMQCKILAFIYSAFVSLPCHLGMITYVRKSQVWLCCKLLGVDIVVMLGLLLLILKTH